MSEPALALNKKLTLFLWCAVGLLVSIGVVAAAGRGLFLEDFSARAEPFRRQVLDVLDRNDPLAAQRAGELSRFDGRFAAHPFLTVLHILPGGLFLILGPFQFSSRLRSRYIWLHRWSGRVLVLAAVAAGGTALYFGLLMPYGGPGEATAIALFGFLFLASVSRAVFAIRTHRVALHREWMIRTFAIAIGISTVRVVDLVFDIALTPAGFGSPELFVLSIWTGWIITLVAAEVWIRYSRTRIGTLAAPASAA